MLTKPTGIDLFFHPPTPHEEDGMLGLGLLAGVSVAVAATLDNDGLGPGAGPWGVGTPEEHGLSSKELDAASKLAADRVPDRYCILVVKDGLIMSESYFNNQTVDGRYGWFAPEQRSIHFFHFYYSLLSFFLKFFSYICILLFLILLNTTFGFW